jgi:hypothetical protein
MALSQGRSLLRQVHQLGLTDVGADAEIDIIGAGTALAEFYQLSRAALAWPKVEAGALSLEQATALIDRPGEDDFWRADSSTSAFGGGGPRRNDAELRRRRSGWRHRRPRLASSLARRPLSPATVLLSRLPRAMQNTVVLVT